MFIVYSPRPSIIPLSAADGLRSAPDVVVAPEAGALALGVSPRRVVAAVQNLSEVGVVRVGDADVGPERGCRLGPGHRSGRSPM